MGDIIRTEERQKQLDGYFVAAATYLVMIDYLGKAFQKLSKTLILTDDEKKEMFTRLSSGPLPSLVPVGGDGALSSEYDTRREMVIKSLGFVPLEFIQEGIDNIVVHFDLEERKENGEFRNLSKVVNDLCVSLAKQVNQMDQKGKEEVKESLDRIGGALDKDEKATPEYLKECKARLAVLTEVMAERVLVDKKDAAISSSSVEQRNAIQGQGQGQGGGRG